MNEWNVKQILKNTDEIKLPGCTYCRTIRCSQCHYFESYAPDSRGQCRCAYKGRWYYPHEGCTNGITRSEYEQQEWEKTKRKIETERDQLEYERRRNQNASNNNNSSGSYNSNRSSNGAAVAAAGAGAGNGACGCLILILVLVSLLESWAIDVGIFKSDITFRLTAESAVAENNVPDALTLVHSEADNRVYRVTFGESGEANCKIRKGDYKQYVIEDRMAFSYVTQSYSGDSTRTEKIPELPMDDSLVRTLILTIRSKDGQAIPAEGLTVTTQSGTVLPITPYGADDTYIVLLYDNVMSDTRETLTVSVPGFEDQEVQVNFGSRRICEKSIKLSKE